MSKVIAVCRSEKKGTTKDVVAEVILKEDYGIENDAHADSATHRQVSLLATESIKKMRDLGLDVGPGDFAENITTEGIELFSFKPGTRLSVGEEATLEITQIGKECHSGCAILKLTGKCIMPKEGVFARVIRGGVVRAGDMVKTTH
jgi:MOSC domain-containing protein YiiM